MCTGGGDGDYCCLWDEQLDVVLGFLLISICPSLPVCPCRVTKGEIVSGIVLHWSFFFSFSFFFCPWLLSVCGAATGVKTSVAHQPVNPDRFCVRGTKHHSQRLSVLYPRGENVNCLLFQSRIHTSENMYVLLRFQWKHNKCFMWTVWKIVEWFCFIHFILIILCTKLVTGYRSCFSYVFVSQQAWTASQIFSYFLVMIFFLILFFT